VIGGDEDKFEMAQVLRLPRLPSQSVISMDSLMISAILSFPVRVLSKDRGISRYGHENVDKTDK
jgi:hypothetical protein